MSKKTQNVLIIGGDADFNRGDRAILYGVILMLRSVSPDININIFGFDPVRDEKEFKVNSTQKGLFKSIVKKISIIWNTNLVVWRGGVSLHDNNSILKVPFWFVNVLIYKLLNKKIIAIGHGVGPLNTTFCKFLSGVVINSLDAMTVRDKDSKIIGDSAAKNDKISISADSALFIHEDGTIDSDEYLESIGIPIMEDSPIIGVSPLWWFHLEGKWIPYKLKVKLGLEGNKLTHEMLILLDNIEFLIRHLVEQHNARILLLPMYLADWVDDVNLCKKIQSNSEYTDRIFLISEPLAPKTFYTIFKYIELMVGMRMHSTIMATMQGIPTIALYYEPKGKAFFDKIGCEELAFDISKFLNEDMRDDVIHTVDNILNNKYAYKKKIQDGVNACRAELKVSLDIVSDFVKRP